jgi:hypothetical protein
MSYFKYSNAEAIAALAKLHSEEKQMCKEGDKFAALFNAKAVYSNDINSSRFHGVRFEDGFYVNPELWTKPTSFKGFACRPKSRAPKGMVEEYKDLNEIWKANFPKAKVNCDEFYKAIGFDWGMLLFCGISYFPFNDAVYVSTTAKPKEGFGAVEIVGSEFDKAKAGFLDAQA